jgi:hypothetical protein
MSINAWVVALVLGLLFAAGDWFALRIAGKHGRTKGMLAAALLVLLPAFLLALLHWRAAGVALLVSLLVPFIFPGKRRSRSASPFA